MDERNEELLHQAELKHYLSKDELVLPDVEREELLLQRKLVGQGLLDERDLIANRGIIQEAARKSASSRNSFNFWTWLDRFPQWLQWVIMIILLLVAGQIFGFIEGFF